MTKILINNTALDITINDTGITIVASGNYTIPPQDYSLWAASDDVVSFIGSGDISVNDGSFTLSKAAGVSLLQSNAQQLDFVDSLKTGDRLKVDLVQTSPNDYLSKVTSSDTTGGYLQDKVLGTAGKITTSVANPGVNEDLVLTIGSDVFDKTVDSATDVTFTPSGNIAATNIQTAIEELDTEKQAVSEKGQPNGYASLDSGGKVPSSQLPAYVDDVLEYANLASFPVTGSTGIIYVALDTNKTYRWSGSAYVEISPSEVNSVFGRTGTVTAQSGDYTASQITNTPSGNISSTTVQAALNELDSEKVPTTRIITAGSGLSGGGDLSSDRTISMPNVGTSGTYGSETQVPVLTTDAQGRVSSVTNTTISVTSANVSDFTEAAQDAVGAAVGNTSNINITYNDVGNSITADLTATTVTAGSYGSGTSIPSITVDAKGRITAASGNALTATNVTNTPSGNIAATTVQAALNELDSEKVPTTRIITAGSGLSGGGDLSSDRTISMPNAGTAGTYGSATQVPVLTTDTKGRVTSVTPTSITLTSSSISDFTEAAQDSVGAAVSNSSNVTLTYNDSLNTITSDLTNTTVTAGSYGSSTQVASITVDAKGRLTSAANTTISINSSNVSDFTEAAQDASASMLTGATHTGISVSYNDAGNTLAITNTDGGTAAVSTHVAATDPHTQYLKLTGRSSGQSASGGTASGENLTLSSTTNATKGKILFGSNSAYDEANTRLGIGTTSPSTYKLTVEGSDASSQINNTSASGVAFSDFRNTAGQYFETGIYGPSNGGTAFGSSVNNAGFFFGSGGSMLIGNFTASPIILGTNSLERVRISSSGSVGINTLTNPNASSILEMNSTSQGLLIPRMTTAQKTAIASPATGLMVYDTTDNAFWYYDGNNWAVHCGYYKAANSTTLTNNSNTTLTNVTDMTLNVYNGKVYAIEAYILFSSALTNTGIALTIGATGATGTLNAAVSIPVAADGTNGALQGQITAFSDVVIGTGVQAINTNYLARITGLYTCTTSGTIYPQFRSEVNGNTVTFRPDSRWFIKEI